MVLVGYRVACDPIQFDIACDPIPLPPPNPEGKISWLFDSMLLVFCSFSRDQRMYF